MSQLYRAVWVFMVFGFFLLRTAEAESSSALSIGLQGDYMHMANSSEYAAINAQFETSWRRNLLLSMKAFKSSNIGIGLDWVGFDVSKDLRNIFGFYSVKNIFFYFERATLKGTLDGYSFNGETTRTDVRYASKLFLFGGFLKVREGPYYRDPNHRATTIGITAGNVTYLSALQGSKRAGTCYQLSGKTLGLCYDGLLDIGVANGTSSLRSQWSKVYRDGTNRLLPDKDTFFELNSHAYVFLLFRGSSRHRIYTVGRIGLHYTKEGFDMGNGPPLFYGPIADFGGHF